MASDPLGLSKVGGGASSTLAFESAPVSKFDTENDISVFSLNPGLSELAPHPVQRGGADATESRVPVYRFGRRRPAQR